MMRIDPLFFLLLIELLVVLGGVVIYCVFQRKKYRTLYVDGMKNLELKLKAQEDVKSQPAAGAVDTAGVAPQANAKDLEDCKKEMSVLAETVKEKNKLLDELQKKLEGVEKEYIILYQEHMKNPGDPSQS